jgi:hypothetical protein
VTDWGHGEGLEKDEEDEGAEAEASVEEQRMGDASIVAVVVRGRCSCKGQTGRGYRSGGK